MRVVHNIGRGFISNASCVNPRILLVNNKGNYLLLGSPESRYNGFFVSRDETMVKVVENVETEGEVSEMANNFSNFRRKKGDCIETFRLPDDTNSMVYETDRERTVTLSFDIKEAYDDSEWGRNYNVKADGNRAMLRFSNGKLEIFVCMISDGEFNVTDKWTKRDYQGDRQRNSPPYERYVYQALCTKGKRIVISVGTNWEDAKRGCEMGWGRKTTIEKFPRCEAKDLAYFCAENSLRSLTLPHRVIAGLPWLFQFWARDDIVSWSKNKRLLFSLLEKISFDGRIPNRFPPTSIGSADAIGWLFKRCADLGNASKDEKEKIREWLLYSIEGLLLYHTKDDFDNCSAHETWMDSIERDGARIEMQALRLNMYRLAYALTNDRRYKDLENSLRLKTREGFFKGGVLIDGLDDQTIRPNIFIAAYAYPKLLSKDEWCKCFEIALEKLWLEWGGLATIDKMHPSFCSEHTGQDPRSYHNGDSWFWINNLAAVVLHRADRKRFGKYIDAIVNASEKEILWMGAVGHHAELSSANELRSQGCLSQAWSSAMFVELMEEMKK